MPSGFSVHAYVCPSGALTTLGNRTLTGPEIRSTRSRHSVGQIQRHVRLVNSTSNREWQSPAVLVITGTSSWS
jgi:hypothetical protein